MKVTIQVFAGLKDYFKPEFDLDLDDNATVGLLKQKLLELKPQAGPLLEVCRFATDNEFINDTRTVKENEIICFFPPSSGG